MIGFIKSFCMIFTKPNWNSAEIFMISLPFELMSGSYWRPLTKAFFSYRIHYLLDIMQREIIIILIVALWMESILPIPKFPVISRIDSSCNSWYVWTVWFLGAAPRTSAYQNDNNVNLVMVLKFLLFLLKNWLFFVISN